MYFYLYSTYIRNPWSPRIPFFWTNLIWRSVLIVDRGVNFLSPVSDRAELGIKTSKFQFKAYCIQY